MDCRVVVVVVFVFNVPPTAKVIRRRGQCLKSHTTDWWSRGSNMRPLVYKAKGLSTTQWGPLLPCADPGIFVWRGGAGPSDIKSSGNVIFFVLYLVLNLFYRGKMVISFSKVPEGVQHFSRRGFQLFPGGGGGRGPIVYSIQKPIYLVIFNGVRTPCPPLWIHPCFRSCNSILRFTDLHIGSRSQYGCPHLIYKCICYSVISDVFISHLFEHNPLAHHEALSEC